MSITFNPINYVIVQPEVSFLLMEGILKYIFYNYTKLECQCKNVATFQPLISISSHTWVMSQNHTIAPRN